ncbi:tRNA isopentenyltransferase [Serendipita vermifera]|nr:tRNA isopentenyltransferase [Serendipita vermifera]
MALKKPIIAVIGTTGVGKSRLGIDIARHCNGEVINADAMQVYRGLDIITNKVTKEEMKGVPHHLMGYLDPSRETFVAEWVNLASITIDEIHNRQRVPVIVGGTSYWLQNLLFPNRIITDNTSSSSVITRSEPIPSFQRDIDALDAEQRALFNDLPDRPPTASDNAEETLNLWRLLDALDPDMAARWHWKDSRKVLRNLEIMAEKGRRASEIIKDQDEIELESKYRTLVFWPHAPAEILNPRLDARVDQMIENGLLNEIKALHDLSELLRRDGQSIDHTFGVFQSIGFKEFHDYLLSPSDGLFENGVVSMKRATQKYAIYQLKWIRKKLLPLVLNIPDGHTYILDTSDVQEWPRIEEKAIDITDKFLRHEELPRPGDVEPIADTLLAESQSLSKPSDALLAHRKVPCELCSVTPSEPFLVNAEEWLQHLKSKGHKRKLESKKKRERNMEYLRKREEHLRAASEGANDPPLATQNTSES